MTNESLERADATAPAFSRGRAALVLADGTVFEGAGFGAATEAVGEVCFNTAMMTATRKSSPTRPYAGQDRGPVHVPSYRHCGRQQRRHRIAEPGKSAPSSYAEAHIPSNYRARLSTLDYTG